MDVIENLAGNKDNFGGKPGNNTSSFSQLYFLELESFESVEPSVNKHKLALRHDYELAETSTDCSLVDLPLYSRDF